jgi:protein phosphatase PTC1
MIVRLDKQALLENQNNKDKAIGVEGDAAAATTGKVSETEKILNSTKAKLAEGGGSPVGVSASNSGKGHDPTPVEDGEKGFVPTVIEGPVMEEEPASIEDSPEVTPSPGDKMQVDSPRDVSKDVPGLGA